MHQARPVAGGQFALAKFFTPLLLAAGLFLSADPVHAQNATQNARKVQTQGELQVLIEDHFENKTSRTRHFLKTATERIELQFKGKAPQLKTGMKLKVTGEQTGNVLAVSTTGTSSLTVTSPAPLPNTLGEHKALVLLVNFQDNTTQPFTVADANNLVFTQSNNFFKENSFQQTSIAGAGYGWLTLPIASSCDLNQIATYAKQSATAAGISLTGYSHYIYFFPQNNTCGWGGMGTVGGSTGDIAINGLQTIRVVSHELGHNFGLYHSHAQECGASVIGSTCTLVEYGDSGDIMGDTGSGQTGHFNTFQKERLGWLNSATTAPITYVQSSGSYTLDAYETTNTTPKALKILKSTDPTTGARTWYYVEYRTALGFDQSLTALYYSNFTSGVVIHVGSESDPNTSNLLDMTPNSVSFDWNDPALTVGKSYSDTVAGVSITVTSMNGSSAGVNVSYSSTTTACGHANPVLTPSSQSLSGSAGTTLTYSVTVTNNDNTACGTSSFALKATPPSGWSGSFAAPTLSVAPGASASTTLSITSPTTATGSNAVGISVANSSATAYTGSATANYQVGTGLQATVMTDKASYSAGQTVKMTSTVKSGTTAVAGASVTFTVKQPNGTTTTLMTTTDSNGVAVGSYKIGRKNTSGSYQLSGYASGLSLTATASANFTVQ
ncbi:MAG: peptidase M11 [Burkholderiales bacterium]|nr:peptidase M11 [Burkholderiales bacterium]